MNKMMIKRNMSEKEMKAVEVESVAMNYEGNVHGIMMELDPISFLDQHENRVKKNMENLMKFMRK